MSKVYIRISAFVLAMLMLMLSVSAEGLFVDSRDTAIKDNDETNTDSIFKQPIASFNGCEEDECTDDKVSFPSICPPGTIVGGIFYSKDEIKDEISKYFEKNSSDVYMNDNEERSFGAGLYYYSTNRDIVHYDYRKQALVSGDTTGTAEVYVYTKGGVPLFKLNVYVSRYYTSNPEYRVPTLYVEALDWNIAEGDKTSFTVTSSDGKTYDDICFTQWFGHNRVTINGKTGELLAYNEGAVIIRAYSKSNPNIYGDAFIYVGEYRYAVCDGGWYMSGNDICVNEWDYDISDSFYSYIYGWIKCKSGIFIPVLRRIDLSCFGIAVSPFEKMGAVSSADIFVNVWGNNRYIGDLYNRYEKGRLYNFIDDYYDCKTIVMMDIIKDLID